VKTWVWKLLFLMGLCPFLAPFFDYFIKLVAHNEHWWTLTDVLILWSFLYWPTYVLGLFLSVFAAYKLKK